MTNRSLPHLALPAAILLLAAATAAPAQSYDPYGDSAYDVYAPAYLDDEPDFDREFSLGIGYTHLEYSDPGNELDALHFNSSLSFAPFERLSQLRLGAGLGWSVSLEDVGGVISSGSNGGVIIIRGDTSLMLFQPELTLGWRQPLGSEEAGFFVEPGVAGGGTFAFYDLDDKAFEEAGGTGDPDEWASTWHAKAYLRAGLRASGGIAGIEGHYLRGGNLDFGNDNDGDLTTWYVGIFGALKF